MVADLENEILRAALVLGDMAGWTRRLRDACRTGGDALPPPPDEISLFSPDTTSDGSIVSEEKSLNEIDCSDRGPGELNPSLIDESAPPTPPPPTPPPPPEGENPRLLLLLLIDLVGLLPGIVPV